MDKNTELVLIPDYLTLLEALKHRGAMMSSLQQHSEIAHGSFINHGYSPDKQSMLGSADFLWIMQGIIHNYSSIDQDATADRLILTETVVQQLIEEMSTAGEQKFHALSEVLGISEPSVFFGNYSFNAQLIINSLLYESKKNIKPVMQAKALNNEIHERSRGALVGHGLNYDDRDLQYKPGFVVFIEDIKDTGYSSIEEANFAIIERGDQVVLSREQIIRLFTNAVGGEQAIQDRTSVRDRFNQMVAMYDGLLSLFSSSVVTFYEDRDKAGHNQRHKALFSAIGAIRREKAPNAQYIFISPNHTLDAEIRANLMYGADRRPHFAQLPERTLLITPYALSTQLHQLQSDFINLRNLAQNPESISPYHLDILVQMAALYTDAMNQSLGDFPVLIQGERTLNALEFYFNEAVLDSHQHLWDRIRNTINNRQITAEQYIQNITDITLSIMGVAEQTTHEEVELARIIHNFISNAYTDLSAEQNLNGVEFFVQMFTRITQVNLAQLVERDYNEHAFFRISQMLPSELGDELSEQILSQIDANNNPLRQLSSALQKLVHYLPSQFADRHQIQMITRDQTVNIIFDGKDAVAGTKPTYRNLTQAKLVGTTDATEVSIDPLITAQIATREYDAARPSIIKDGDKHNLVSPNAPTSVYVVNPVSLNAKFKPLRAVDEQIDRYADAAYDFCDYLNNKAEEIGIYCQKGEVAYVSEAKNGESVSTVIMPEAYINDKLLSEIENYQGQKPNVLVPTSHLLKLSFANNESRDIFLKKYTYELARNYTDPVSAMPRQGARQYEITGDNELQINILSNYKQVSAALKITLASFGIDQDRLDKMRDIQSQQERVR